MYIIGPIGVVVKILTWIFSMIFGSRVKADGSVDRRFGSGFKNKNIRLGHFTVGTFILDPLGYL